MALDDDVALVFLGYLLLPVAILLLIWLIAFIRRRVLKKGGGSEPGAEQEP